jgi:hypothetical protein
MNPRLGVLLLPLLCACAKSGGGANATPAGATDAPPPSTDGLTRVDVDLNEDGRADVVHFLDPASRRIVSRETDLNVDGRVDVRTWYDADGVRITREEMDGDFDGEIDWVDYYENGARVRAEIDTDYDGSMDVFKDYRTGVIERSGGLPSPEPASDAPGGRP